MKKFIRENPVVNYLIIAVMAVLYGLSFKLFIVPNNFAPAGFNGIATMVQYKLGFSIGYMSLLINVPLCIFSFFSTDRKFAVRTFIFCVIYSVSYLFIQQIDTTGIEYNAEGVDTIFPCLLAGMTSGLVYGIIFQFSCSTGGTDIVAKYINKKHPQLNFFWVSFVMNAIVAAASFFVYAQETDAGLVYDYKPVCLCVLYCFTSSFIGDRLLQGQRTAYHFVIVTTHAEEIAAEILTELKHSATRVTAQGVYSHNDKDILLCVINKHQIVELKNILRKYDNTFSYVEPVNDTIGNFKRVK